MIETNKCPKCLNIYDVSWDDREERDDDNEELENLPEFDEQDSFPQYCPFCGIHREYCGEEDGSDDF